MLRLAIWAARNPVSRMTLGSSQIPSHDDAIGHVFAPVIGQPGTRLRLNNGSVL